MQQDAVPHVLVCGPVSWNHLISLDRLPEPVPHMQFAQRSIHTVGGTSAGKAVHLHAAGVDVDLHALIGDDDDGRAASASLRRAGVSLHTHASDETERHVNLMTDAGERVSLYVSVPSSPAEETLGSIEAVLRARAVAVLDLSELGAALLARRRDAGWTAPVWADLHDYDGASAFHEPFVRAADVVFMNDDRTDDPWRLMQECLDRGPRLAVCTRGARGAVALDAGGVRASAAAVPVDVVDTNGAGDAFFAGFLAAHLRGVGLDDALTAGADAARVALASVHLHPSLA